MSLLDGYSKSLFPRPRNGIISRPQNKVFFQGLLFIETAGEYSHIPFSMVVIVIIRKIRLPLFLGVYLL